MSEVGIWRCSVCGYDDWQYVPHGDGRIECVECGAHDQRGAPTDNAPTDHGYSTKPRTYWPEVTAR